MIRIFRKWMLVCIVPILIGCASPTRIIEQLEADQDSPEYFIQVCPENFPVR